ncbi:hypothetical protein BGW38_006458 [Lunasporangiospora selenospora]|uniref:Uncharacterized protein n=1 Tax=Lunasporangiospora selenospora TaxID=979761 RepID=A0A9P6KGU6_9FUNG|nr:hypothetical protein BGW38_006458 [Lunasporangiospora selenospora]
MWTSTKPAHLGGLRSANTANTTDQTGSKCLQAQGFESDYESSYSNDFSRDDISGFGYDSGDDNSSQGDMDEDVDNVICQNENEIYDEDTDIPLIRNERLIREVLDKSRYKTKLTQMLTVQKAGISSLTAFTTK